MPPSRRKKRGGEGGRGPTPAEFGVVTITQIINTGEWKGREKKTPTDSQGKDKKGRDVREITRSTSPFSYTSSEREKRRKILGGHPRSRLHPRPPVQKEMGKRKGKIGNLLQQDTSLLLIKGGGGVSFPLCVSEYKKKGEGTAAVAIHLKKKRGKKELVGDRTQRAERLSRWGKTQRRRQTSAFLPSVDKRGKRRGLLNF